MFKALLVEDDDEVIEFIQTRLSNENFQVEIAKNGDEAIEMANKKEYDIILLDLLLPGCDGLSVLKNLRKKHIETPIIAVTAIQDNNTKIQLLNNGADDYIEKPFSIGELIARMHAVLRRTRQQKNVEVLKVDDLKLYPRKKEVYRAHRKIHLRNKEFALLEYLLRNQGIVITRHTIMEKVWGYNAAVNSNTIDTHVAILRKKIDSGHQKKLIHTLHAVGYKLCIEK
jgi:DNA-binding response OmpR family regulator